MYKPTKNVDSYLTIHLQDQPEKLAHVVKLGRVINAKNRMERRGMSKNYHAEYCAYMVQSLGVYAHGIEGKIELFRG